MTETSTTYAVRNPATGELVETFPTATDAEIAAGVDAAAAAYASWGSTTSAATRAGLVRRAADLHLERRAELAAAMVEEMGKPLADAEAEVDFSAAIYEFYAANAERFLAEEEIALGEGEGTAVIQRRPVGVLLGIMPWNFPAYQIARFVGPNLAIGNTIVLKHAPQCPRSAALLEQIFRDAGFPEGAYVNVYATNEQVADIIADPRVQGVSLTGSERAGAAVAEIAGRNLKKVVLELGGSDPFVVLSSGDLDATVDAAVFARMDNAGQVCNGGKRFIVVDDLYDDFVQRFTDKLLAASAGSPLSSSRAADVLTDQVEQAVAGGATLVSAGERDGAFYPSGVLSGITTDNPAYGQELFGPVAMVFRASDEDDAVRIANDTPYGLGSYVFSADPAQAQRVADRIEAGMVFVNGVGLDAAELPFGGIKRSGFGRELGRFGMEEFVNKKMIRTVT
ncbi:succinate-semialdehyde dehydrogenase/glutarate-semialdehyde dehydrogenase [Nocardioides albertanoniae]|uniref:Succinate-semialdehyde dehydrogenase/glutarate-semialdehyde dehydrogenase n=1 Tax=Nocardioides albertanoniae TaxID=1175486 RepID=A0A543A5M8_9ACTN|nr:NAD-dependent succinate-semialdehyde dehydrogenase [Nocardioides albertanoniae]TQL67885.1 succinate-semialdehyde dehydrogenase/glutarate-semialdehyde dehydrogenase [Nocardioides albertanoniae]